MSLIDFPPVVAAILTPEELRQIAAGRAALEYMCRYVRTFDRETESYQSLAVEVTMKQVVEFKRLLNQWGIDYADTSD